MISVTKTSQIEQGALYWIRGDSSWKEPIPPQMFLVESPVQRDFGLGRPYVRGLLVMNLGNLGTRVFPGSVLYLEGVGVYDTGWSEVEDFNRIAKLRNHDRHLEKVPEHITNWFKTLQSQNGYHEIARAKR